MTPPRAPVRVCLFGVGAIGSAVARTLLASDGVEIAGAIDIDPAKAGRDLRSVLRLRGPSGVVVSGEAERGLRLCRPDVVIHSTGSRLEETAPQLESILDAGLPCVTSCEEVAFPEATNPEIAARLDVKAHEKGVALLGAGVNPGFVMDGLVLSLAGAARNVSHVFVERVLDPLSRRKAFRKKVGVGLSYRQASRLVEEGRLGHVGLRQSANLVARGMGWRLTSLDQEIRILCEDGDAARRTRRQPAADAPVVGLQQTLSARDGGRELIRMEMIMAAGVEAPHDAITISGEPDLSLWIQGGVPGDQATVACLVNGVAQVLSPPRPGLLTLLDLPLRAPARGAAS